MQFLLHEISRPIQQSEDALPILAAKKLGVAPSQILECEIVRKSIDARSRRDLCFKYSLLVRLSQKAGEKLEQKGLRAYAPQEPAPLELGEERLAGRAVVIGAGPCGLFAALLLAQHGFRPLVLERGAKMAQLDAVVQALREKVELNPDSNICF